MSRLRTIAHDHRHMLMKTGTYYVLHILVAACVAYLVTGNLWASLTLSLLEPTVQAVAFFFHERAWERAAKRQVAALAHPAAADRAPPAGGVQTAVP